jgi:uncharacterized protein YuzE
MRVTYDRVADAAYISLTEIDGPGPRETTSAETPNGADAWIALDWNDGRLIGIEVLDASHFLPDDLLAEADHSRRSEH